MGRLVALGDSFSCGEGVGLRLAPEQTWVAVLAESLALHPLLLATPGATVADAHRTQLPLALATGGGEFASVLVGLNDVFKRTFDPAAVREHVADIVTALAECFDTVLVGRWHDPLTRFVAPRWLRDGVSARIAEINSALDAAVRAAAPGFGRIAVVDLAAEPDLALRQAWAVDRVHPSECGHRLIAHAAWKAVTAIPAASPVIAGADAPSLLDEGQWLARHGAPWILRRLGRIAGPVVTMALNGRDDRSADAIDRELVAAREQPGARGDVARV